ncbi:MAG: hypothetical protein U1E15_03125 [Hyphomicrobiales bacterium]
MGFFDLPAPALQAVDAAAAHVANETARIVLWAGLTSALVMALYRKLSNQKRIAALKAEIAAGKRDMADIDAEDMGAVMAHSRKLLGLSLKQIGASLWPTLVSGLPVLFVFAFLGNVYSYTAPEAGAQIAATVVHADGLVQSESLAWPLQDTRIDSTAVPSGVSASIAPRGWTARLFGNPAGYLNTAAAVERIDLGLQPKVFLSFMPDWLSGWEVLFLAVMTSLSLAIKFIFRIE